MGTLFPLVTARSVPVAMVNNGSLNLPMILFFVRNDVATAIPCARNQKKKLMGYLTLKVPKLVKFHPMFFVYNP